MYRQEPSFVILLSPRKVTIALMWATTFVVYLLTTAIPHGFPSYLTWVCLCVSAGYTFGRRLPGRQVCRAYLVLIWRPIGGVLHESLHLGGWMIAASSLILPIGTDQFPLWTTLIVSSGALIGILGVAMHFYWRWSVSPLSTTLLTD